MNKSSTDRLAKVHPVLAANIEMLAAKLATQNITIEVVQGLRTFAEQDALFAQGRTKPGKRVTNARAGHSNHNYGLAVDVCPFVSGQPQWNDEHAFHIIGKEAKLLGLEWGGDWVNFVDEPHIQLPGLTIAQCLALYREGGIAAVWAKFH